MVDSLNRQRMAAQYGFALAFMKSDPELWHLFGQAVKHTWDANLFVAKLRATKWFQGHSSNVRNAIMQQTSDPSTYKAGVDSMFATVRDSYGAMFGTAGMDDKDLHGWAETAYRMGWSQAQLLDHVTKGINYQKLLKRTELGGTAAEVEGQLNSLIDNYGLQLGNQWKAAQMEKILKGNDTISGTQQRVRDLAKREYGAFADQIDGGATVAELADPYKQQMASLLEMDPGAIDTHDKMIQSAMRQTSKDGKPAAMSMADFADKVRADQRWQYTDNAKQQVSSTTQSLLQQWGLIS